MIPDWLPTWTDIGDRLWDLATSPAVMAIVIALLLAALIVGYFPLLKWFPIINDYVAAARLASYLVLALLMFLAGFRVADNRAEAADLRDRLAATTIDLTAAQGAEAEANRARQDLASQADADKQRIADYEKELSKRKGAPCLLSDADFADSVRDRSGRLRQANAAAGFKRGARPRSTSLIRPGTECRVAWKLEEARANDNEARLIRSRAIYRGVRKAYGGQ